MEIIFWTALTLILGKVLLKVVRPDINRFVDRKIKKYYKLSLKWLEQQLQK